MKKPVLAALSLMTSLAHAEINCRPLNGDKVSYQSFYNPQRKMYGGSFIDRQVSDTSLRVDYYALANGDSPANVEALNLTAWKYYDPDLARLQFRRREVTGPASAVYDVRLEWKGRAKAYVLACKLND